ncbi:MAG: hypothetical protein FWD61_14085 [Phycisphaerales bacterium]|nr:hypothetical protein [Phycisphaerales bacterium]
MNSAVTSVNTTTFRTGIEGLDDILGGGIKPLGEKGRLFPSVLIRGSAGAGKSSLCCMLARECIQVRNQSVVYFSLDQAAEEVERTLNAFAHRQTDEEVMDGRKEGVVKVVQEMPIDVFELGEELKKGELKGAEFIVVPHPAVSEAAKDEDAVHDDEDAKWLDSSRRMRKFFQEELKRIKDHIKDHGDGMPVGLVVVDSLFDALREATDQVGKGTFATRRKEFFLLSRIVQDIFPEAMVVLALETAEMTDWRDFVAEVIIEVGIEPQAGSSTEVRRFVSVRKARHQSFIEGRHVLQFRPEGMHVSLTPQGVLRRVAAKLEELSVPPSDSEQENSAGSEDEDSIGSEDRDSAGLFTVVKSFNDFLALEGRSDGERDNKPDRGASILLTGDHVTRKNIVAVGFLQQALQTSEHEEVLYLAINSEIKASRKMLQRYWAWDQWDRTKSGAGSFGKQKVEFHKNILKRLHIEVLNELGELKEDYISKVWKILKERPNITRVMLNDVAVFQNSRAEVVNTLKTMFTKRGVTALFVQTTPHNKESDLQAGFDNVIQSRLEQISEHSKPHICYRVMRWNGSTRGTRSWELVFDAKTDTFVIADTLQGFVEDGNGRLRLGGLTMHLFYPQEGLKPFWKENARFLWRSTSEAMRGNDTDVPVIEVFGQLHAELVLDGIRQKPELLSETVVVNFDEPWIKELKASEHLELLDFGQMGWSHKDFYSTSLSKVTEKGVKGCLGIPHHLDRGFYTVNSRLFDELKKLVKKEPWHQKQLRLDDATDAVSWAEGLHWQELVDVQKLLRRQNANFHAFGCMLHDMEETSLCIVLEILWPFLLESGEENIYHNDFYKDEVIAALYELAECFRALDERLFRPLKTNQPTWALIERHWYVTFRDNLKALKDKRGQGTGLKLDKSAITTLTAWASEKNYEVIKPPKLRVGKRSEHGASLCGDWYLGVLKGSVNPERGKWALRALTTETINLAILREGLGLPALGRAVALEQAQKYLRGYEKCVSRLAIDNYLHIRRDLVAAFAQIFTEHEAMSLEKIEEIIMSHI